MECSPSALFESIKFMPTITPSYPLPWAASLFVDVSEFESELVAIERRVAARPAGLPRPVVFYGSSSIRLWDTLTEDFPGLDALNCGFGGSTLAQCARAFQRIVLPAKPRFVVFYAGDNDIAQNRTPEAVWSSFLDIQSQLATFLPDTPSAYISIKPSPSRWHLAANIIAANKLMRDNLAGDINSTFVDVFDKMLSPQGKPRNELFQEDMLHMNREGYRLWADELRTVPGILDSEVAVVSNEARVPQVA